MSKLNFWVELWNRFSQKAPLFHQKLISFGKWLVGFAIALVAIPAALEAAIPNTNIDLSKFTQIAGYLFVAGLVLSATASTAVKDPDYTTLGDKKVPEKE